MSQINRQLSDLCLIILICLLLFVIFGCSIQYDPPDMNSNELAEEKADSERHVDEEVVEGVDDQFQPDDQYVSDEPPARSDKTKRDGDKNNSPGTKTKESGPRKGDDQVRQTVLVGTGVVMNKISLPSWCATSLNDMPVFVMDEGKYYVCNTKYGSVWYEYWPSGSEEDEVLGVSVWTGVRSAREDECSEGGLILSSWADSNDDGVYHQQIDTALQKLTLCNSVSERRNIEITHIKFVKSVCYAVMIQGRGQFYKLKAPGVVGVYTNTFCEVEEYEMVAKGKSIRIQDDSGRHQSTVRVEWNGSQTKLIETIER